MALSCSSNEEEPASCVICLEEFLLAPVEGGGIASVAEPLPCATDTDIKNKNKSVSTLSKSNLMDEKLEEGVSNVELETPAVTDKTSPPDFRGEVASISGCNHIYHDKCIKEWSSVTNSKFICAQHLSMLTIIGCPTCRTKFNEVTVRTGLAGPVSRTYKVKNKRAPAVPHPDLDGPPAPLDLYSPMVLQFLVPDELCGICGNEDSYLEVAVCFCCQQSYHTQCLQANYESPWDLTCPTCNVGLFSNGINSMELQNDEIETSESFTRDDPIFNLFQRASRQRYVPGGRITDSHGLRTSSRLQELRRLQEFQETISRVSSHLFDSLDAHMDNDDELIEAHVLREVQRESRAARRNAQPRGRPRAVNLLRNSLTSPPPPVRPQISPEEIEAWNVLDQVEGENNPPVNNRSRSRNTLFSGSSTNTEQGTKRPRSNSISEDITQAGSSSSNNNASSGEKKYKRPSRRPPHTVRSIPTAGAACDDSASPDTNAPQSSSSNPTPVQLLLSSIRSSVAGPSVPAPLLSPSASSASISSIGTRMPLPSALGASSSSSPSSPSSPASPSTSISSSPLRPSSPVIYDSRSMAVSPLSSLSNSNVLYSPSSDGEQSSSRPNWSHQLQSRFRGSTQSFSRKKPNLEQEGQVANSVSQHSPLSESNRPVPKVNGDLDFEEKEKIQGLVRDVLRPLYRSGAITKDEYTTINKRVSRVMYRQVFKEQHRNHGKTISSSGSNSSGSNEARNAEYRKKQLSHWKTLVEYYVTKERAKTTDAESEVV